MPVCNLYSVGFHPPVSALYTVNSRLADTPLSRTLANTDKIQISIYRVLPDKDSRYNGLSLFRTQNDVPKVSAITRVGCTTTFPVYSQLSPCGHPALRTLANTDKIQIPISRGLTENDFRYYGLSPFRTENDVPKVSAITRVDCIIDLQIVMAVTMDIKLDKHVKLK